jgi:hypothetical protein
MDELLQVAFELLFQLGVELFADGAWRRAPESVRRIIRGMGCVFFAALLSVLYSHFAPDPVIKTESLRLLYLAVVPILIGCIMAHLGKRFRASGKEPSPLERFGFGWLFAFTFAFTRYLMTR